MTTYLITYYYKNDLEQRQMRHDSMQVAIATANLYVIDSIVTEYGVEK